MALQKLGRCSRLVFKLKRRNFCFILGPTSNEDLLTFIDNVRKAPKQMPVLVHCSAGIGRTGVYIGLDILLNKLEAESIIDVHATVQNLRKARPNMVQNYDQYLTLYELIAMAIKKKTSNE